MIIILMSVAVDFIEGTATRNQLRVFRSSGFAHALDNALRTVESMREKVGENKLVDTAGALIYNRNFLTGCIMLRTHRIM